jgi:hypothetical protein
MKQTAVEWYAEQSMRLELERAKGNISINEMLNQLSNVLEKAKAMEKEQHDKTAEEWWKEGAHYMESGGRAKWESFEQYYNETFKSE